MYVGPGNMKDPGRWKNNGEVERSSWGKLLIRGEAEQKGLDPAAPQRFASLTVPELALTSVPWLISAVLADSVPWWRWKTEGVSHGGERADRGKPYLPLPRFHPL